MPTFFAPTSKGSEPLLAAELEALGAGAVRPTKAGVGFEGPLEMGYRALLWCRTASRVLLRLTGFEAFDSESLYDGVSRFDWFAHFVGSTFAVDASGTNEGLRDERFIQRRVKDAIVDLFVEHGKRRPAVDTQHPELRLHLRLAGRSALLSVDLAGRSLHARGYRRRAGAAPLREDLAAAVLLRGRWPAMAQAGGALLDPMCGAGTLLIEGLWMAADVAPGLLRAEEAAEEGEHVPGTPGWKGHDAQTWRRLLDEARERRAAGLARKDLGPFFGRDVDPGAIEHTREAAARAGIEGRLDLEVGAVGEMTGAPAERGLLVANPPYGERLEDDEGAKRVYAELGQAMRDHFVGWSAAIIEGRPGLGFEMNLRAKRRYNFFNGPLEGRVLCFEVAEKDFVAPRPEPGPPPPAEDFANRLRKNLKRIDKWARRAKTDAYRVYDADLPEYAIAVDRYGEWVCVQEYEAPKTVDPAKARARLRGAMAVIPEVTDVPAERVVLKRRRRQRGTSQYEKLEATGETFEVREGGARLLVNLHDYLDTGLFLDHRVTRKLVAERSRGKRLLNLFCYTASVTVQAALAGASSSLSVDMSRTYVDWAERNFRLNGIDLRQHRLVQGDVLAWIAEPEGKYDVIFVDPPTFSNSKRMETTWDVERDHAALLVGCQRALAPGGVILFTTNKRKFRIDESLERRFVVKDLSAATIPEDFKRRPNIHRAYELTPRS